jgi:NagD protein
LSAYRATSGRNSGTPFLVLTNNSIRTPRDLRARLLRTGLDIPEDAIWTSALATARFLDTQRPNGSAYVVGESGLTTALHEIGYVITDVDKDYDPEALRTLKTVIGTLKFRTLH